MNILTLENITKVFTERKVFDETSFYMEEGEKVGIIGINGTGKSTLLKVIAGLEEVDEGKVIRAGGQVIRYLSQIPEFVPERTVIESVLYDNREQTELWNKESDAKTMLTTLGITNFTQKMGELSGGQRKRIALVAALLAPADVLLLDEPTNHLDQEMADWLEEYLKNSKKSIVMVTHDRYFLDSVCNRIVELDKGKIYSYNENYSGFLQRKAEREEIERAGERKRQAILRTELACMAIYTLFIQHVINSLKTKGKGAIVIPTGFITAKSGVESTILKHIVDEKIVYGCVSMPSNVFANTGTNVSVLFFDNSKSTDKVVLIDASKLGEEYKDGNNQKRRLRDFEIDKIVDTFLNKEVVDDFSVAVTYDEIKEKKYSLAAGQYFDVKIEYVELSQDEFNARMNAYATKLKEYFDEGNKLQEEIMEQLKKVKYE